MKKIITTAVISMMALVGCTTASEPAPTVTITEQAPPNVDDGVITGTQAYVNFVKDNGGRYASIASDQNLINLGNIVCDGYRKGLSQDDIVGALAYGLTENGMNNQDGARLAAAIIVGAERFLCNGIGA